VTLLEQNHIYLRLNSEPPNPILKKILCYPHFTDDIFSERLDELQSLQIDYFELQGPTIIDGIHLLGKGTRGIVVKAYSNNSSFALKIRRTDSPRLDLINEAKIQNIVNQFGIAPKILNFTKNFISMEFIDGFILNDYIHKFQNNLVSDLRHIIADLLYQCFILDINGIDHGELSNLKKHVIITDYAHIIDFDSASQTRKVSNLTSSAQYLFIGGPFSSYFQKIFSIDVNLLKTMLKNYKFNQNYDNFNNILEILDLHL
tara:strand:- start:6959 stop:7735 length:777 start_codon:yes stop_codon:yes gene_type:complete